MVKAFERANTVTYYSSLTSTQYTKGKAHLKTVMVNHEYDDSKPTWLRLHYATAAQMTAFETAMGNV